MNTAFQIFNVVTKNRCHLWCHTFKKSQKYLYNCKNLKKPFLLLKCFNVLLHLEYTLLLCKPKIEFKNLPGAKALATDHRVMMKQLSTATTPFCFGFYQCCVDVLQTKIWRSTISIAEFSICKYTPLYGSYEDVPLDRVRFLSTLP